MTREREREREREQMCFDLLEIVPGFRHEWQEIDKGRKRKENMVGLRSNG